MFPGPGALVQAVLFALGVAWCVFVIRRLPSDLAELKRTWKNYRSSRNPRDLSVIRLKGERLTRFRQACAREFWTTLAVQVLFFWPLTAVALVAVVLFAWGLWSRIASAF